MPHERVLQSEAGREAMRFIEETSSEFEADTNDWLASLEAVKATVEDMGSIGAASPDQLEVISKQIERYEEFADGRSKMLVRLKKRSQRDIKQMFKDDVYIGAALRVGANRLIANEEKIINGLLDYALFLRAVRADVDPGSRGGPVFNNPDDMSRYLDSVLG